MVLGNIAKGMGGLSPADQLTLSRLLLAPLAMATWLLLPTTAYLCYWVPALLCLIAEGTDWLDGKVARARGEVSDFGKLADPFCDVIYRMGMFMVLLLPPALGTGTISTSIATHPALEAPVYVMADGLIAAGLVPWLPVLLMVWREIIAGALRTMAATKGLVLAARMSGKVKAWVQGFVLITLLILPAIIGEGSFILRSLAMILTWVCAILSVYSMIEYLGVNWGVLKQLAQRQPLKATDDQD